MKKILGVLSISVFVVAMFLNTSVTISNNTSSLTLSGLTKANASGCYGCYQSQDECFVEKVFWPDGSLKTKKIWYGERVELDCNTGEVIGGSEMA